MNLSDLKTQGNEYYKKLMFDKAIDCYTKALKENPSDCTLITNRASCYMQKKDYKKALEDSQLAIQTDPNFIKGTTLYNFVFKKKYNDLILFDILF